jgi:hypothetical protein
MYPDPSYHMQARQQDRLRSAAQDRQAAQAKAARPARRDQHGTVPRRRVLRLVWRLLPS